MLRVLTFSTLYPSNMRPTFGGFVERQTARLAAADGVDLRVVAPLGVPPFPLDRIGPYAGLRHVARSERWNEVSVERPRFPLIPSVGWRFNPMLVARGARPVLKRLRAEGFAFDVIDAEFFYPCGVAAVRLGREFGVPVSVKARGSDIHYWGSLPAARRMIVEAAREADGLLAVSEALKRDMAGLGIEGDKIKVHYTGVDLDRFRPRPEAKEAFGIEGPLVVSVGNLVGLKRHDLAIRAMTSLPGVTLLVAGGGPEHGDLDVLIGRLGLRDRVHLLGSMPHDAVAELLAAADVLALASEREGLANVWVEALASGTPVVASEIGSIREVVDRPEAGIVVPERTPEAFAAAIRRLLDSPPDRQATRAAAERFTWARNTEALKAHLEALAARR